RKTFFESNTQQYTEPSAMFADLFKSDADIILLGDEHSSHETETMGEILKAFGQSALKPDCLLIEKDKNSSYAHALQAFFAGSDTAFSGYNDPSYFMRWNGDMVSFVSYMTNLRSLGIKAIAIDDNSLQDSSSVLANLNARDQGMAATINKLISDKTCHKALYSIGELHILKSYAGQGRKTLYHHLAQSGHRIRTVFLIIAGKMSTYSDTGPSQFPNRNSSLSGNDHWSPTDFITPGNTDSLICKTTLDILDHSYAFLNKKKTDSPLLYLPSIRKGLLGGVIPGLPSSDNTDFYGRYSDFDAVWVHPCQEQACKQADQATRNALISAGIKLYQPLPFQKHELDWPITFLNGLN
ncbi:MAG: hypothetical protein ACXVB4_15435, partial [Pseudobdellovibrionaceae bacterium]